MFYVVVHDQKLEAGSDCMMREYSVAHLTYMGWTPPEMIYNCHSIGYEAVSLRTISQGLAGEANYDIAMNRGLYKAVREALDETGIYINDIELAKIAASTDVRDYEPAFEAAASLGVKNAITNIWTDNKTFYTEQFALLCDIASQYSVDINLEFVTWAKVADLNSAYELIKEVKRPNAKIVLDTLHFYRSRVTTEDFKNCPKELFKIAHICDAQLDIPVDEESLVHTGRRERLYPGDGAIDIAGVLKELSGETVFCVEIPNEKIVDRVGAFEHVKRCLARTKDYLARHGVE